MPKILQLDRHVADLIAAGEVVERPASAVKELVENAVDAGATQVTVEIQNGGMTYLRVTDNGCGIAPEDVETAFLRHATSKLRTKEDLAAIGTLGFRGEALAAIASVSKIDLMTKTAGREGVSLSLEAGRVVDRSPAGCPEGTTIVVRDLFFNTPARLKFMKRDTVESSHVAGAVQRQALAHPEVAFRLLKDGETVLHTAGNGDLHGTVYQVYGRQLAVDMVPVKSQWEGYSLTGFVTKPTATRGNRNYQQFFVNGRPVKSKLMTAALEEAYDNQMMTGRFPSCVLCLELPRPSVDVNVHPAKTEVKFANERAVFDCIRFGVLSSLNKTPGRPEMKLGKQEAPPYVPATDGSAQRLGVSQQELAPAERNRELPSQLPGPSGRPAVQRGDKGAFQTMTVQQFKAFNEALSAPANKPVAPNVAKAFAPVLKQEPAKYQCAAPIKPAAPPPPPAQEMPRGGGRLEPQRSRQDEAGMAVKQATPASEQLPVQRENEARQVPPEREDEGVQAAMPIPEAEPYRIVGEVLDTYIIVEQGDAVLFLDKHAAHERILFEKLKADDHPIMAQVLLAPLSASLTQEEAGVLLDSRDLLERYGYEIEDFGDGSVLIRQIPADLDEDQAESALEELAGNLLEGRAKDPRDLRDDMLHTIACKAAIKAGWHTEPAERASLVKQVMSRDDIKYCPHGRPVITTLTRKQLEKQFKR